MAVLGQHARKWLAALLVLVVSASADETPGGEYPVKAALLFHFTKYVKWPAEAFAAADAPLVIGVLGADPFGEVLDQLVRGETVQGRPVVVRRGKDVAGVAGCHVVFVNLPDATDRAAALAQLKGRAVLTVGDADQFLAAGGVIELRRLQNRIRFDISTAAAETNQLRVSSQLLKLAQNVTGAR